MSQFSNRKEISSAYAQFKNNKCLNPRKYGGGVIYPPKTNLALIPNYMMASVPDTYWLLILQHEGHMCQISRIGLAYNWLYCSILNQKSIILSKNYNLSRFKQNFKRAQISCFLTKFYEIWNYSSKLSILTGHSQKFLILCI